MHLYIHMYVELKTFAKFTLEDDGITFRGCFF